MRDKDPAETSIIDPEAHGEEIETLVRAIEQNRGGFALIIIHCDYAVLRRHLIAQVIERAGCGTVSMQLDARPTSPLLEQILGKRVQHPFEAVVVDGFDDCPTQEALIRSASDDRGRFSVELPVPVVLFISRPTSRLMADIGAHFLSVAKFERVIDFSDAELEKAVEQTSRKLCVSLFDKGAGVHPKTLLAELAPLRPDEVHIAAELMQTLGLDKEDLVKARIELLRGLVGTKSGGQRARCLKRPIRCHYSSSVNLCRGRDCLEHVAAAYLLGLWYMQYGMLCGQYRQHAFPLAARYYGRCLDVASKLAGDEGRQRFINAKADSLRRRIHQDAEERRKQTFEELRRLADEGLRLHERAQDPRRLARAQAYRAMVALEFEHDPDRAGDLAQQALDCQWEWMQERNVDPRMVNWERKYHRGYYYCLRGKAALVKDEIDAAIEALTDAKEVSALTYDPQVYGEILEALVTAYRRKGDYARAFSAAMELRSLRHRYGRSVFAGLIPTESLDPLTNPVFQDIQFRQNSWQFGRKDTIDQIVKKVRTAVNPHIVLFGPQGVGKSSVLRAGVLPKLTSERINDKPVKLKTLDLLADWRSQICEWLDTEDTDHAKAGLVPAPDREEECLDVLERSMCSWVLVLDDVDEFVISHKRRDDRWPFWRFLAKFSERHANTKVIMTIDQDFIYVLAEFLEAVSEVYPLALFDIERLQFVDRLEREQTRDSILGFSPKEQLLRVEVVDEMLRTLEIPEGGIEPLLLQVVGAQLERLAQGLGQPVTLEDWQALDQGKGQKEPLVHEMLMEIFQEFMDERLQDMAVRCTYLLSSGSNIWERTWTTAPEVFNEIAHTDECMTLELVERTLNLLVDARLLRCRVWSDDPLHGPVARYRIAHESMIRYLRSFAETQYWEQVRGLAVSRDVILVERHGASALDRFQRDDQPMALIEIMRAQRLCMEGSARIPAKLARDTADRFRAILSGVDEVNRLEDHQGDVNSLAFSSNGETLVSGGDDDQVIVWDRSGRIKTKIRANGRWVTSVKIDPAGTRIAAGCTDGTVKIWTLDGDDVDVLGEPSNQWVYSIKYLPDRNELVVAYQEDALKIWSLSSGEVIKEFPNVGGRTFSVDVSPDGKYIATGSVDHYARIWDCDGRQVYESEDTGAEVHAVKFSNSGSYLAFTHGHKDFSVVHYDSAEPPRRFQGHTRAVNTLAFNADDSLVASGGNDNRVRLWRVDDSSLIKTYRGHTTWVRYVVFDPLGEFVVSSSEDRTIRFWRHSYSLPQNIPHPGGAIHAIAFCSVNWLLSGDWDGRVQATDLASGQRLWQERQVDWIWDVAVHPKLPLVAESGGEGVITLRDCRTGQELQTLKGHRDCVHSMSFSPDGLWLASASGDRTVRIWRRHDAEWREEEQHTYNGHEEQVWGVCFHPREPLLASGGTDRKLHIWRLDGTASWLLQGHEHWINSLAFHPGGDELATASNDGTVRIWQRRGDDWQSLPPITAHAGKVFSVVYDPLGRFFASAGVDGVVKIWSRDGRLLRNLQGHTGAVNALAISPDGKRLASASDDQLVKIWSMDDEAFTVPDAETLMRQARSLINDYLANHDIKI